MKDLLRKSFINIAMPPTISERGWNGKVEAVLVTRSETRPRMAIIGGGGAMGRLFARLFCEAVQELYLFDYFATGTNSSILSKVLDDVRIAAEANGLRSESYALAHTAAPPTWSPIRLSSAPPHGRILVNLAPKTNGLPIDTYPVLDSSPGNLADFAARASAATSDGCLVFTCLPEDGEQLLPRADIILFAIGIDGKSSFAEAVRYYAPWLRPGSLVVDLGSTKTEPLETLCQELDPRVGVLGAHPLFGPAVSDLTGLIVAVVEPPDGRPVSPWRQWLLDRLAQLRFIVTPTQAQEHDDAMSFVQALTHFTLLSFAYTFVRLNRDPADLLAFRTPVFEPLLYLAARVAYLARSNPDTYRSIQRHIARPDTRTVFLETAKDLLAAIEQSPGPGSSARPSADLFDPLADLFLRYGSPWSPDGRDRRERQRREHFLEMGARLVDGLNHLRQEIVTAAGQVRAIEEKRVGQPPRIVVGIVDLDLLDPGKQDVASRIRLRPVNLLLGSVQGGERTAEESAFDYVIPLARARVLGDAELLDWLLERGELVERRTCELLVPDWFDRDVLVRLLKRLPGEDEPHVSRVWDVSIDPIESRLPVPVGKKAARVTVTIVLHPAELVAIRHEVSRTVANQADADLRLVEAALADVHRRIAEASQPGLDEGLQREKDRLKHQRKKLLDRKTMAVDREVRRLTRSRVQRIHEQTVNWLTQHGCSPLR